jgi:hypothetical protein
MKTADRDEMIVLLGLCGTRNVRSFLVGKLNEACCLSTEIDMRDASIRQWRALVSAMSNFWICYQNVNYSCD